VSTELISMARSGDPDAFRALTEPHRSELRVHCYRMLGSVQDAEDAVQDTMLDAWRGLAGFEERASLRTWLYRIATHRCVDVRRSASRRPAKQWDVPMVEPIRPTSFGEVPWLEPFPDNLLPGAFGTQTSPAAHYEQVEAVSLAFVTAMQTLPPRQVSVLILRDVLGFHADEVAVMLDCTIDSANSALKRARASLQARYPIDVDRMPPPAEGSSAEQGVLDRFVKAWEAADVDALVELLTDDVFMSMPPIPFEYSGRDIVAAFCGNLFAAGRRFELVPTRANGQPAFGAYLRPRAGLRHGTGLYVLAVAGEQISAMTRFETNVMPWFGLPPYLPSG
jgi:RNA polymerase sigma-70 factor (TIGR02960 family)